MLSIYDYYQKLETTKEEAQELFTTFINFYLYFKNMHDRKKISKETILFLDKSLDFTDHVHESETKEYLEEKYNYILNFLTEFEEEYDRFSKNFKITFELPNDLNYPDICTLIKECYIAYASIRYKQNILNTKTFEKLFKESGDLTLPKYIPDKNAQIKDFLEVSCGIKRISKDSKAQEWFNVFNEKLSIRVIVDTMDGQIATIYINGEEHNEVSIKLIRQIKKAIKKGTSI